MKHLEFILYWQDIKQSVKLSSFPLISPLLLNDDSPNVLFPKVLRRFALSKITESNESYLHKNAQKAFLCKSSSILLKLYLDEKYR